MAETSDAKMQVDDDFEESECSPFDALPEELLERILAAVPAARRKFKGEWDDPRSLLSLRLVCRRWSRVALGAAVWRHRRVFLDRIADCQFLRMVPALDSFGLLLYCHAQREILLLLADVACEVRTLLLDVNCVGFKDNVLVAKVLENRRGTLQEVVLELNESPCGWSKVVLDALDAPGLQSLTLSVHCVLEHKFRSLTTLEKLHMRGAYVEPVKTLETMLSLVAASSGTLVDVDCSPCHEDDDVLLQQVAMCPRLRSAVVQTPMCGRGLRALLDRPDVEVRGPWGNVLSGRRPEYAAAAPRR